MIRQLMPAAAVAASVLLAPLLAPAASAEDAATVRVAHGEEYGPYLTDGEGRAVYLFTADTRGTGDEGPQMACSDECLDHWPPFHTEGPPRAGTLVSPELLGTIEHEGRMVVTYNGWPLYYFATDKGPEETTGQEIKSHGGQWHLVTPGGGKIDHE